MAQASGKAVLTLTTGGAAAAEAADKPTRIAAIDIGSNSIRQIIADVSPDGSIRVIDELKASPRLGAGLDRTGQLIDAAADAAGDNLTVGGVSFNVDDTEALIGAARASAVHNAGKRAGEYAAAAGATVGGVTSFGTT